MSEALAPIETRCLLFTDVEGSTQLLRDLRDDYAGLIAEHHQIMREALAANGGEEVDTEGDGFFAVFTDATAAMSCTVAAQRALLAGTGPGRPLKVRMALHWGGVRRGPTGYIGMAIHEAARVSAAANGGQVVVTAAVAAQVAERPATDVRLVELGLFRLKDFPEPQRLFQVDHPDLPMDSRPLRGTRALGSAAVSARSFADALSASVTSSPVSFPTLLNRARQGPFLGRSEELARLHAGVGDGPGWRMVAVGGEPGVGKTRSVAELASTLHGEGATILFGRIPEAAVAPFQAMVEALRGYVATAPPGAVPADASMSELARIVPEIPAASRGAAAEADDALSRYRLFEAIGWVLDSAAADRPVLVVLDDLHWADGPTLALLSHLLRGSQVSPVTFLATYRASEASSGPVSNFFSELSRDGRIERLALGALAYADAEALAHAIAPDASQAASVAAHAGGNPLFIREMALHTAPVGVVPTTVSELVTQRVASLGGAARRALTIACVAGAAFDAHVIEALLPPEDDVVDALEEAIAAGVVVELPDRPGQLVFTHAVLHEALYQQLSNLRRCRLHFQMADALERAPHPSAAAVAQHLVAAGSVAEGVRVVEWSRRAGQDALRSFASEDAVRHFQNAVHAASDLADEPLQLMIDLEVGDALWLSGSYADAQEAFRRAAATADRLGDPVRLADAALGYGGRVVGFDAGTVDPALGRWLRKALADLPAGEEPRRAQVMARLAETADTPPDERIQMAREALAQARTCGDPLALANTLMRAQLTLWDPGNAAERLAFATDARVLAESVGESVLARDARAWQVSVYPELGDLASFREELRGYAATATELGHPYGLWLTGHFTAVLAHAEGRFADAETAATEAFQVGAADGNPGAGQLFGYMLSVIRREQARGSELEPAMLALVDNTPENRSGWLMGLALLYAEDGRGELARPILDELYADGLAWVRPPPLDLHPRHHRRDVRGRGLVGAGRGALPAANSPPPPVRRGLWWHLLRKRGTLARAAGGSSSGLGGRVRPFRASVDRERARGCCCLARPYATGVRRGTSGRRRRRGSRASSTAGGSSARDRDRPRPGADTTALRTAPTLKRTATTPRSPRPVHPTSGERRDDVQVNPEFGAGTSKKRASVVTRTPAPLTMAAASASAVRWFTRLRNRSAPITGTSNRGPGTTISGGRSSSVLGRGRKVGDHRRERSSRHRVVQGSVQPAIPGTGGEHFARLRLPDQDLRGPPGQDGEQDKLAFDGLVERCARSCALRGLSSVPGRHRSDRRSTPASGASRSASRSLATPRLRHDRGRRDANAVVPCR